MTARFDEQTARTVLARACVAAQVECTDPQLLRLGENAIFRLHGTGTVVRIARGVAHWDDAVKEVNVARWLGRNDFPSARTTDLPQPILVDGGYPVTFWSFIEGRTGGPGDVGTLAALLRRLHALPRPESFELPEQELLERVEPRIESAPIDSDDKDFLLGHLDRLSAEIASLSYELPAGPVHGDAHVQNLMFTGSTPTVIDFEAFSWGQPEWDLGMTATEYVTAGWWTAEQYRTFADDYGFDVTRWEGFPVVRATHELKMTTWVMQNVRTSEKVAQEYATRMATLRKRENIGKWSAF
ncbi:aminoglycoside phosphotransferase (APT) family kinase protein [Saccharothrix tamanrassetensis]|uniref:Aminoglycoside phosphotransferase (APT) family kinase protein n=1 Tax=Saccharothrix tamanrassetensis TaxID=1051531 RepID=A0A841CMX2_9PSEU|nr:aminoglycoside phosphotransferase family protein [Saccharothrix tamanrassetensis]MBB5958981.1 aminoglycoside phosphotransferase (APT) family kinase protein [Saccharothrix tamanrassetensis]